MAECEICGTRLLRSRRSLAERILYASVYKCAHCAVYIAQARRFALWFARRSNCPKCGNKRLDRLVPRDGVERLYRRPLILARTLLRAKLFHCPECDLHFYRLRKDMAEVLTSTAGWGD